MKLGALHSFNTVAPAILGDRYELMRYVSMTYGRDLSAQNRTSLLVTAFNVANNVTGMSSDIDNQLVLTFKDQNGQRHMFLEDWIDMSTVTEGEKVSLALTISPISETEIELAVAILQREGFNISSRTTTLL